MLADTSNFWSDTYPLIALGTLVVALLCNGMGELKSWLPLNVRRGLLLLGLVLTGGEVIRVKTAQAAAANSATVFLNSDKRSEVRLTLDGKPVPLDVAEKGMSLPLKKDAPNVLEVREGQELVASQPLTQGIYAVNCSSTFKISCEEVIYSSAPRTYNSRGNDTSPRTPEFLLRDVGRGIFSIKKAKDDAITGFVDNPPSTIQTSHKPGQAPAVSMKTMWWLHTVK